MIGSISTIRLAAVTLATPTKIDLQQRVVRDKGRLE